MNKLVDSPNALDRTHNSTGSGILNGLLHMQKTGTEIYIPEGENMWVKEGKKQKRSQYTEDWARVSDSLHYPTRVYGATMYHTWHYCRQLDNLDFVSTVLP